MTVAQRLPFHTAPNQSEVGHRLQSLHHSLDWALAAAWRTLGAGRADNPPPFLGHGKSAREYPISSAEGLALMRLARRCACARCRNRHCPHRRPMGRAGLGRCGRQGAGAPSSTAICHETSIPAHPQIQRGRTRRAGLMVNSARAPWWLPPCARAVVAGVPVRAGPNHEGSAAQRPPAPANMHPCGSRTTCWRRRAHR